MSSDQGRSDFYPYLTARIAELRNPMSIVERQQVYAEERSALGRRLIEFRPPVRADVMLEERRALDDDIDRVETLFRRHRYSERPKKDDPPGFRPSNPVLELARIVGKVDKEYEESRRLEVLKFLEDTDWRQEIRQAVDGAVSAERSKYDAQLEASNAQLLDERANHEATLEGRAAKLAAERIEAAEALAAQKVEDARKLQEESANNALVADAWLKISHGLKQDAGGAQVAVDDDGRLSLNTQPNLADREVAAQPITIAIQKELVRKSRLLADRVVVLSNQPAWRSLPELAETMAVALAQSPDAIADDIARVWSLSLSLGTFYEQSAAAKSKPDSTVDSLELDIERVLVDFITTAAPWVRRFPTARNLDEEALQSQSDETERVAARELLIRVSDAHLLTKPDVTLVSTALNSGDEEAVLTKKARSWGVKTVRNIAVGVILYLGYSFGNPLVKETAEGIAKQSETVRRTQRVVLDAESELTRVFAKLPTDIRTALSKVLEAIRKAQK